VRFLLLLAGFPLVPTPLATTDNPNNGELCHTLNILLQTGYGNYPVGKLTNNLLFNKLL